MFIDWRQYQSCYSVREGERGSRKREREKEGGRKGGRERERKERGRVRGGRERKGINRDMIKYVHCTVHVYYTITSIAV